MKSVCLDCKDPSMRPKCFDTCKTLLSFQNKLKNIISTTKNISDFDNYTVNEQRRFSASS